MKSIFTFILIIFLHPINEQTNINIYSGSCTYYKKTFIQPNHVKYTAISRGFGKLVVNRTAKTLNFYYNGQLIFSRDSYDSYIDGNLGGEGFTSYNGAGAFRYIAERKLDVDVGETFGNLGYQYEISDYKEN